MAEDEDAKPRTAAQETEKELRRAARSIDGEQERQRYGEAGDALNTRLPAQEAAQGEPDEGPDESADPD